MSIWEIEVGEVNASGAVGAVRDVKGIGGDVVVVCLVGRRPPGSTRVRSSAASDVYKRQVLEPCRQLTYHDKN